MGAVVEKVRGGKRLKLEQIIIDAGYHKTYAKNTFNRNSRIEDKPKKVFIAKLARAMGLNSGSFTAAYTNKSGLSKKLAQQIIDFLKKNHNINPTFRL
jgi:hypothetical protein